MIIFLSSGDWDETVATAKGSGDRLVQVLLRGHDHESLWRAHRDELLAEWLATWPGTRPNGWWLFDAPPEPRHWIFNGHASPVDIPSAWTGWRELRGVQITDRTGRRATRFESQAHYLKRLGLLAPGERARLRRGDFVPQHLDEILVVDQDEPNEIDVMHQQEDPT
jgi:hypothetical protein